MLNDLIQKCRHGKELVTADLSGQSVPCHNLIPIIHIECCFVDIDKLVSSWALSSIFIQGLEHFEFHAAAITAWLIFVLFVTEKDKSNSTKFSFYGFGGFKAITTCCLEHDIYILFQNARCQKSNILCKSSNILCKPYLPMFAP